MIERKKEIEEIFFQVFERKILESWGYLEK